MDETQAYVFTFPLERGHLALRDATRAGRPRSHGTPALPGACVTSGVNRCRKGGRRHCRIPPALRRIEIAVLRYVDPRLCLRGTRTPTVTPIDHRLSVIGYQLSRAKPACNASPGSSDEPGRANLHRLVHIVNQARPCPASQSSCRRRRSAWQRPARRAPVPPVQPGAHASP